MIFVSRFDFSIILFEPNRQSEW